MGGIAALWGFAGLVMGASDNQKSTKSGASSIFAGIMFIFGVACLVVGFWMGSWKTYQCASSPPAEIKFSGHLTEPPDSQTDEYLVVLYLDNIEASRTVADFKEPKEGQKEKGYFEITIPNDKKLTRCDFDVDVEQDSYAKGNLGLQKILYLRRAWDAVEIGSHLSTEIQSQKLRYTLVVVPDALKDLPNEIKDNPTALDEEGNIIVNVPVEVITSAGRKNNTYDICSYLGTCKDDESENFKAWISKLNEPRNENADIESEYIDMDNCANDTDKFVEKKIKRIYIHEVSFDISAKENKGLSVNFGALTAKVKTSLKFSHGQMDAQYQTIYLLAPAKSRQLYKLVWKDVWKEGIIEIDAAGTPYYVPFRAKSGALLTTEGPHNVVCP